jgi:hypothetical protein
MVDQRVLLVVSLLGLSMIFLMT